jgi:hypothetical protein
MHLFAPFLAPNGIEYQLLMAVNGSSGATESRYTLTIKHFKLDL